MDRKDTELRKSTGPGRASRGVEGVSLHEPESESESLPTRFELLRRQAEELHLAGRYEAAVHVWTRALFLERGHREARRGMELAQRALAERQRRLDAAAAEASRLFQRGEIEAARERTRSVLAVDPRHAEACHLDSEIRMAERRSRPPAPRSRASGHPSRSARQTSNRLLPRVSRHRAIGAEARPNASPVKMGLFAAAVLTVFGLGGGFLKANWEALVDDAAFQRGNASVPPPLFAQDLPPVPNLDALYYQNGARLFAKARYREAREELSRVGRGSAVADDARKLILRIEDRLLRSGSETGAAEGDSGVTP